MQEKVLIYDINFGNKSDLPDIKNGTRLSELDKAKYDQYTHQYTEAIFEYFPSDMNEAVQNTDYAFFRACLRKDKHTKVYVSREIVDKYDNLRKIGLYQQDSVTIGKYGVDFIPFNCVRTGSDKKLDTDWIDFYGIVDLNIYKIEDRSAEIESEFQTRHRNMLLQNNRQSEEINELNEKIKLLEQVTSEGFSISPAMSQQPETQAQVTTPDASANGTNPSPSVANVSPLKTPVNEATTEKIRKLETKNFDDFGEDASTSEDSSDDEADNSAAYTAGSDGDGDESESNFYIGVWTDGYTECADINKKSTCMRPCRWSKDKGDNGECVDRTTRKLEKLLLDDTKRNEINKWDGGLVNAFYRTYMKQEPPDVPINELLDLMANKARARQGGSSTSRLAQAGKGGLVLSSLVVGIKQGYDINCPIAWNNEDASALIYKQRCPNINIGSNNYLSWPRGDPNVELVENVGYKFKGPVVGNFTDLEINPSAGGASLGEPILREMEETQPELFKETQKEILQKIVGESASNYWFDNDGALQPKTSVINELAYNTLKKKLNEKSNFYDKGVPFCPNYVNDVVIANKDPTRTTVAAVLEFKKGLFCNGRKLTSDDKYNVKDGDNIISLNDLSNFKGTSETMWNNAMNMAIDEIQKKEVELFQQENESEREKKVGKILYGYLHNAMNLQHEITQDGIVFTALTPQVTIKLDIDAEALQKMKLLDSKQWNIALIRMLEEQTRLPGFYSYRNLFAEFFFEESFLNDYSVDLDYFDAFSWESNSLDTIPFTFKIKTGIIGDFFRDKSFALVPWQKAWFEKGWYKAAYTTKEYINWIRNWETVWLNNAEQTKERLLEFQIRIQMQPSEYIIESADGTKTISEEKVGQLLTELFAFDPLKYKYNYDL